MPGKTEQLLSKLDLPEEVTLAQAARILNVDRKTVLGYLCQGLLSARDISLPSSHRQQFRFPLTDVLKLRTTYQSYGKAENKRAVARKAAPVKGKPHIKLKRV